MKYLVSVLTFIYTLSVSQAQEMGISAQAFGALPEVSDIEISPDGTRLALLQNYQGKKIIVTRSLSDPGQAVNGIPSEEGEYNWVKWTSNNKILASIRFSSKRDSGSRGLTDTTETRLIYMDWDGKNMQNPIMLMEGRMGVGPVSQGGNIPQFQDDVVDFLDDEPEHILIQLDLEQTLSKAVYKLNLRTKDRHRILRGRSIIQDWKVDSNHVVRFGEGRSRSQANKSVRHVAYYRKEDGDGWDTLFEYDELTEDKPFNFVGFEDNPEIIFISKWNNQGNLDYFKYNVDSKEIIGELSDTETNEVTGGTNSRVRRIISANFPDENVSIYSKTPDEKVFILKVVSPINPGSFYILDFNKGSMDPIAYNYAALDYEMLSEMKAVKYQTRDGLEIPGYLTLPKNSDGKNLPTVIMPHGGPRARDSWEFDYWVQFLVAQGISVLQMNYRGSTGYGAEFEQKGHQEWGRKMLEDINDGAKWMIDEGYANPDRLCIMGGSYGGYAALQGVVKDSNLYKCSVSFAPIADMSSYMAYRKRYADYKTYENYVLSDEWTLDDASPINNIDKINIPVLLIHGNIDRRVRVQQSREFYDKMEKAGKDIKYIEFEDGDHFLSNEEHRIEFLSEVERFLAEHLKDN